jgi:hypothetical protein
LTGRWIRILVKVLDIAVVASDVEKWRGRSAWWRLGCGGLVLTLFFVLDFCAELFLWYCWLDSEIFLEFLKGSFLFFVFFLF